MRNYLYQVCLNVSPFQRALGKLLFSFAFVASIPLSAQVNFIAADNLTPFQPRDVGTTSEAKTVRIQLTFARALTSIAVAPGFTEFTIGAVSGCVVDGHTVNAALSACSVDVTFSPKYPGLRTAPLVVTDSMGKKSSLGLAGTGFAPQAALTPGIITAVAGIGQPGHAGIGGPATGATIDCPEQVAIDIAGNFYFGDPCYGLVYKVDAAGIITVFAGNGSEGYGGDHGPATNARIGNPFGAAVDAEGNVFIADPIWDNIRRVDINGTITTYAGTGHPGFSGDGGQGPSAALHFPIGLAVDKSGNLYFADSMNQRIRKVDTAGIITTVAGNGAQGFLGDGGPATSAGLNYPGGVVVDAAGNLYIADSDNQRIRKVDNTTGIITTVAGNGAQGFLGDGGPASNARLNEPSGVAVDAAGNLYIADNLNARLRRVDTNGRITTLAGNGNCPHGIEVDPANPSSLCVDNVTIDSAGNIYISDLENHFVRKLDVSQSAVNFSAHTVGSVSPNRRLVVTNTGNLHMDLGMLDVTGDFSLFSGLDASYCSSTPDIGPGFSCALPITFSPTAVGTRTGSATMTDNSLNLPGMTQHILLSGTGVNP